ncbi:hypothetical protein [Capnocytophaga cynodegmi]|uniref:hypothetical protein n=1 Tax=Capnocytophaga cynodegmi TaxID=28189 RepID=UPI001EE2566A|nr:hypothetical protein [Capnocytophaga cynodegmi]
MTTKQKLPQEAYYSVMGFLAPIMIECIDNLQGTNQYRQELKMHLNRALQECEKISNEIYVGFAKADKQELLNKSQCWIFTTQFQRLTIMRLTFSQPLQHTICLY